MNHCLRSATRALAPLAVLATMLTLVTACGRHSDQPDVVVIVPSATANEPGPVLSADDRALLTTAASRSDQATAYVLDPATDQPVVVPLTPRRPDGQVEHGPRRGELITQNVDRVEKVTEAQSATRPFDLLALIAAAVKVTSPPGTLLVLSSGLSTAGGFELQDVGWDAGASSIANELRNRRLLPALDQWRVVFSGLGDTAGRQPALPLPQQSTLAGYWLAICRAAGAADCGIDDMTRPDPPARSTTPVPIVPVPAVMPVPGPKGSHGVSVPTDELFAFDRSDLVPGADQILAPLVAQARAGHLLVSITGFASPDGGTSAYNTALSLARARSVQRRMLSLGLLSSQITSVTGKGTAHASDQACYRGGQLDEAICAQMRRVLVLLTPRPTADS